VTRTKSGGTVVNSDDADSLGININEIFGLLNHCESIFGRDSLATDHVLNEVTRVVKSSFPLPKIVGVTPKISAISDFVGLVNRFYED
jgi:hypothetical protein